MKAMQPHPVAAFVEALRPCRLLEPGQMEEVTTQLQYRFREPNALARELIARDWLTPYQVNQLHLGRGGDLLLGSYVLLERLGKGGMGMVYKARHRRLDRLVALKVIRKEYLANPTALMMFHREIMAAARLAHPNIVLAFDADAVDGVHFFTMEYVDGTTLYDIVNASGPLQVPMACEAVRQAAHGLQHAHEQGLVHRDIKPTNLMLTWTSIPSMPPGERYTEPRLRELWGLHTPLIKILDMGLARTNVPEAATGKPKPGSQTGMLMGTPDFMAPEQALNAHSADIRSDLYSLGCTFYFLLTGKPPFPGGVRLEKLMRHRTEEPKPVEHLQPQVPRRVGDVVRRLMAKLPEDRYPTPLDLAADLGAVPHPG